MRLVLYQPDIPQNVGAAIRLGACLGVGIDIVEPCGFVFDDRRVRRAGLDYVDLADLVRYPSWQAYAETRPAGRLILLSTKGRTRTVDFAFAADDRIVLGRESSGVPPDMFAEAGGRAADSAGAGSTFDECHHGRRHRPGGSIEADRRLAPGLSPRKEKPEHHGHRGGN